MKYASVDTIEGLENFPIPEERFSYDYTVLFGVVQ